MLKWKKSPAYWETVQKEGEVLVGTLTLSRGEVVIEMFFGDDPDTSAAWTERQNSTLEAAARYYEEMMTEFLRVEAARLGLMIVTPEEIDGG